MDLLKFEYKGVVYNRVLEEPKVGDQVISKNQLSVMLMGRGEVPLGDPRSDPTLWRTEGSCQLPLGCPIDFTDVIKIGEDSITVVKFQHFTFGFNAGQCRLITGLGDPSIEQRSNCPSCNSRQGPFPSYSGYYQPTYGAPPMYCTCGLQKGSYYR